MTKSLQQAFALHQKGQFRNAEALYLDILRDDPRHVQGLFLLGTLYCQKQDFSRAIACLQKSLQLKPDHPEACNSLGNAYHLSGNLEKAEELYRQALSIKPEMKSARDNLVVVLTKVAEDLRKRVKYEEAQGRLEEALSLAPHNPVVLNALGLVYNDRDEPERAITCYEKVLAMNPNDTDVLGNLAYTLKELGEWKRSRECLDRFLELEPDNPKARYNRGLLLWERFDFANAFEDIEARLETEKFTYVKKFRQPFWDGSALGGKSLLIYLEQGLTEQVSMVALLGQVVPLCGRCVVEGDPRLLPLFRRSFLGVEFHGVANRDASPFFCDDTIDFQIPSWSLMRHFRKSRDDFVGHSGYLRVSPEKNLVWRQRVRDLGPGLKVGISWRSAAPSSDAAALSQRSKTSTDLSDWRELLGLKNCHFVNLQYGEIEKDLEQVKSRFGATVHIWDDLNVKNDLDDVAALIHNLDVVISINSFVAYFANALGKPMIMLCHRGFKASLPDRFADDPMFPKITCLRQRGRGDWKDVVHRVCCELQSRHESVSEGFF